MPSSLLFATNSEGRVYTLPTSSAAWREFPYLGLEFKKVSAVANFMWAIGGDRQVYVHVHGLDVPIRVKEESYENERWLPIEGFSKTLLPTDRYKFSSADGSAERSIDKIRLPSMAWQWDGDWHLDLDLEGQTLAEDGWMYALDFPATYSAKNSWNSYVRRRKWVRYRRYSAMNSWCAVAPLHKDPTQEPFIDVAIGGTNVPNAPAGTLIVWAITAHGRAMFRTGVSATAPEGLRWTAINTWPGNELAQISVGPTGNVWAVLYSGRVLVRTGVTRDNLSGVNWLEVKAPPSHTGSAAENNLKITQVSVGTNAVWCMTSDHRIWFRRGVKGEAAGISEEAATGNGWVEMIGNVSSISVAPNDQVFAVGSIDRALYFRTGVSASDLTGKKWRQLQCPMQISRTSSSMSIVSRKSGGSSTPGSKQQSFSNLYNKEKEKGVVEMVATIETVAHSSSSTTSSGGGGGGGGGHSTHARFRNDVWKSSTDSPPNIGSLNLNERHKRRTAALRETTHASSAPATEIAEISGKSYETQLKNPRAWSPVRSVGSVVGMEAHPETDSAIFDADSTHHGSDVYLGEDDDHAGSQYWTECEVMWSCVAAGAVVVDPSSLPNWFNETSQSDNKVDTTSIWRKHIIDQLTKRQNMLNQMKDREKYEKAVKLSSWVKSAEGRYQRPDNEYEDCLIELEWVNANGGSGNGGGTPTNSSGSDTGTFSILHPDGVTAIMQFSLSGITCVQCCSEPSAPRIAIHVQHLSNNCSPVRVQYATDAEMEDWLSHLSSVCCQINEVRGKPAKNAIWTTTDLGDVYVFDPISLKSHQWLAEANRYVQRMDVTATETPYYNTLYNGMPCGAELEITGCVYDDADQIRFDLQCHAHVKSHEKLRVTAMHLNPRFNERTIVLNSMNDSEWLDEIRNDKMVFAPGATFTLKLKAHETHYEIVVNDVPFTDYKYRAHPEAVSGLYVSGRVKLFNIVYKCPSVILSTQELFWRPMGGHVKRAFSCSAGVVWAMSCDNTAWVYNGGWGGSFLKGLESGSGKINAMIDTHVYYVYENQRWNPISGFTTKSLPTDRHMWSDATGRQKRSKEHTKLLSTHYEWISDWMIDYNIPGGADKEGWQYAIDFPASYHGQKRITDCVRRRRWMKRCRLMSSGPWQELSHSKILDASLQVLDDDADSANVSEWDERSIAAWAVASNGDVLTRYGVSAINPRGDSWEHIPSEQPLIAISVGPTGQVWVVGRNGVVFFRYGISKLNPHGDAWQQVEAPNGITFKTVSVGKAGIWALDSRNRLAVRREVSKTFPEGSHWQFLPNVPNIPPHSETQLGFKSVSVGTEVWAVSQTGIICKRCGITKENPAGAGWNLGISGQWQHVSVEGFP